MSNLFATMTQHPVGQGGMMSGLLTIPGGRFHWVYDCGSNQSDALNREIATVGGQGEVDCLFLSHLDSDHISGIDRLLMATGGVEEVVLPYLNDFDRLVVAAHDAAEGRLSGGFLTFLGDMAGWFGARGVERVTFIQPRSDDDDPEELGPDLPAGGRDGGEGEIFSKWSSPSEPSQSARGRRIGLPHRVFVQRLQTNSTLALRSSWGMLDWIFAPYAHRPSVKRIDAFRSALFKRFGRHYRSDKFLAGVIHDKGKLEALREAYDLIWSDHNLVSMALYAGPTDSANWSGYCTSRPPVGWGHHEVTGSVGWLGTGDMHLRVGIRRSAFFEHYNRLLEQVNVFVLPHHGSHRNFHHSLPTSMSNMSQCVAAAGPNGYGHPHDSVREIVQSAGRQFIQVSDRGRTILQWRHTR